MICFRLCYEMYRKYAGQLYTVKPLLQVKDGLGKLLEYLTSNVDVPSLVSRDGFIIRLNSKNVSETIGLNISWSRKNLLIFIIISRSGGLVEWLMCRTINLRIASRMGSNPVRGKPLFP